MYPTTVLQSTVNELIAADSANLADEDSIPKVWLVAESFVPGKTTAKADLTIATYTGSAAKSATAGVQQAFIDPTTGDYVVQLIAPAGGWVFECTATPAEPEDIFGYVVTNADGTKTYGSEAFDEPQTIELIGQAVDLGSIRLELSSIAWDLPPEA